MNMKRIGVFATDDLSVVPSTLVGFIEFWKAKLELVPEEFKEIAQISIEAEVNFGCPSLEVNIDYLREETESEKLNSEQADRDKAKGNERKELAQLAALKRKYGQ